MADQFPTSLRPQRSMSPMRYAQQLRGTRANTSQTMLPPAAPMVAAPMAAPVAPAAPAAPVGQPFQSMLPDTANAAPPMFNATAPGTMAPRPAAPSLRSSSPMRQDAKLGVNGIGSSSPMGGGRGGGGFGAPAPFVAPMHPASTGAMPDHPIGGGRGVVNPPMANPSAPQQPNGHTGNIRFDPTTNTFSDQGARDAGWVKPSVMENSSGLRSAWLGKGDAGTPGNPTAQTMAIMDGVVNRQPGALPHQMKMSNLAATGRQDGAVVNPGGSGGMNHYTGSNAPMAPASLRDSIAADQLKPPVGMADGGMLASVWPTEGRMGGLGRVLGVHPNTAPAPAQGRSLLGRGVDAVTGAVQAIPGAVQGAVQQIPTVPEIQQTLSTGGGYNMRGVDAQVRAAGLRDGGSLGMADGGMLASVWPTEGRMGGLGRVLGVHPSAAPAAPVAPGRSLLSRGVDAVGNAVSGAQNAVQGAIQQIPTVPEIQQTLSTGGGYNMRGVDAQVRAAGLRNGGGVVPGHGEGDKIPAMYEPGEFVVSNDMLEKEPSLRGKLTKLRTQVLAEKGKTPAEADAGALAGDTIHAAEGLAGVWEDMKTAAKNVTAKYTAPVIDGQPYVMPKSGVTAADLMNKTVVGTPGGAVPEGVNLGGSGGLRGAASSIVPEGVNWKNPIAAAGGAGKAVANVGTAAGEAAAGLGKGAVKALPKVLGPASNAFGVIGHTDAYGTDSPLSIGEQFQLAGQDALRFGGTALGTAFGGGVGSVVPVAGTLAGGMVGGYYGDQAGRKLGNALLHGDDILKKHGFDPDRNVINVLQDAMKGAPGAAHPAQPAAAQAAAGGPTAAGAGAAGPAAAAEPAGPASLPGMGDRPAADVAQHLQGVARDAALADQMEAANLRGQQGDPREMLMEGVRRATAARGGVMSNNSARALESMMGNDTNLEGHRISAKTSAINRQVQNDRLREEIRQHGIANEREERKFGYQQDQDAFGNGQTATKAYTEQLGSKYMTKDENGKPVVDAQKVSEHMMGAQQYVSDAADAMERNGDRAGAARVRKGGFAGLDDKDKAVIDQGMAMKNIVRANKGMLPGTSTFVDSNNPVEYSIVGEDGGNYILKNKAVVPKYLINGGASGWHPGTWFGNSQQNNFTNIGQPSLR